MSAGTVLPETRVMVDLNDPKTVPSTPEEMVGTYVVVRAEKVGIFAGVLAWISPTTAEVIIKECRRIWSWEGAETLSQLALEGTKKPEACQFTVPTPCQLITCVLETIVCTAKAEKSIREVPLFKV